MVINWEQLMTVSYWFNTWPSAIGSLGTKVLLSLFFVLLGLSVFFKILSYSKQNKSKIFYRLAKSLSPLFLTMGILELLLFFFFYEGVYLLSARFWFLIWLIVFIVWLVYIVNFRRKKIVKAQEEFLKKKEFEKYLP